MRLFKKKKFIEGVLVEFKMADGYHHCVKDVLMFELANLIFPINGHNRVGGGSYSAFFTRENAAKIEKFIENWRLTNKNPLNKV